MIKKIHLTVTFIMLWRIKYLQETYTLEVFNDKMLFAVISLQHHYIDVSLFNKKVTDNFDNVLIIHEQYFCARNEDIDLTVWH